MKDLSSGMKIIISQALGSKGFEAGLYKGLIKLEMAPVWSPEKVNLWAAVHCEERIFVLLV